MIFRYHGYDSKGQRVAGLLEADSTKAARKELVGRGVSPSAIAKGPGRIRLRTRDRAEWYQELAILLQAGIPLEKALSILSDDAEPARVRFALAVRGRIKEGDSVSAALTVCKDVTLFETALVRAAETSGTLGVALEQIGAFLEERVRIRERIVQALSYPALVVVVALGIGAVMLGGLLPRAQAAAGELARLPWLTRWTLGAARIALPGLPLAALLLIAAFVLVRSAARGRPAVALWCSRLSFRVPTLGPCMKELAMHRFCRTLGALLDGGAKATEAVTLAGQATANRWVSDGAARASDAIRNGSEVSRAVESIPIVCRAAAWIRVGEASGSVASVLGKSASRAWERWDRRVARALAWIEPALILVVASFVLVITLAVLLPILSLSQSIVR